MPLTLLRNGETGEIKRIGGQDEIKRFLERLGFVTGEQVKIVSVQGGSIIVQVKESRIAVSNGIANRIMV